MQDNESTKDFDLTCWYLNLRRVIELTGSYGFNEVNNFKSLSEIKDDQIKKLNILAHAKDALVAWTKKIKPPTLGQLLLSNTISSGTIFTHYSNFYCRGLKNYTEANFKDFISTPLPEIYSKLDDLSQGLRLQFKYHPEHLVRRSSFSGHKTLSTPSIFNC